MANDAISRAEEYLSAGDFHRAIRALQSLGMAAERADYEAVIKLAGEIRARTSKGRERTQCDGLVAHGEKSIRLIDHPEERVTFVVPESLPSGDARIDVQRYPRLGSARVRRRGIRSCGVEVAGRSPRLAPT